MGNTEFLQTVRDKLYQQGQALFETDLYQYCQELYQSTEYYDIISKHIQDGIISIYNKHLFSTKTKFSGSPKIYALPMLRQEIYKNKFNSIPTIATVLGNLSMVIKSLQTVYSEKIIIQDFGALLYILWELLETTDKREIMQQLLHLFLRSVSIYKDTGMQVPTLVFHDYTGLLLILNNWNEFEREQELRRTVYPVNISADSITSFYSNIMPTFFNNKFEFSSFMLTPIYLIKQCDSICRLDKFMFDSFNKYCDVYNTTPFYRAIIQRRKKACHYFSDKYFPERVARKCRLISRKSAFSAEMVPYTDHTSDMWNRYISTSPNNIKMDNYNPFTEIFTYEQAYNSVDICVDGLSIVTNRVHKIIDYLGIAVFINKMRIKKYGDDNDNFLPLNINFIDNTGIMNDVSIITALNDEMKKLNSSSMYKYTYTIFNPAQTALSNYILQQYYAVQKEQEK